MSVVLEEFLVTLDTKQAELASSRLGKEIGKLDNNLSKSAKAMMLFETAGSSMGGKVAEAASKVAGLAGMMAIGGPFALALGATVLALAGVTKAVTAYGEAMNKAEEETRRFSEFATNRARMVAVDYEQLARDINDRVANYGKSTTEILIGDLQDKTFAALDQLRILDDALANRGLSDEERVGKLSQREQVSSQLDALKKARASAGQLSQKESTKKALSIDFGGLDEGGQKWAEDELKIHQHNLDEKSKADDLYEKGLQDLQMSRLEHQAAIQEKMDAAREEAREAELEKERQFNERMQETGMAALNLFSNAVSSTIEAWADGTNEGVGKALRGFLRALGSMLIAKGSADVLMGTANVLIPGLQGPGAALIAAGGAEIALGAGLVAANRGQSAVGATGGGSGGGGYVAGGGFTGGNQYNGAPAQNGPVIINIQGAMSTAEAGKEVTLALKQAYNMGYT